MRSTPELNRLGRLFRGADDGHYDLPGEVVELRRALAALDAPPADPAPDPSAVREQLVRDVIAAARAGKPLPSVAGVVDAERVRAEQGARAAMVRDAGERVSRELVGAVSDLADDIVVEHLRPALVGVLAAAGKVAGQLGDDTTTEGLLRGTQKARDAWFSLEPLAARYSALRAAQSVLPAPEVDDEFSELKNHDQVWPLWRGRTNLAGVTLTVPWPEDPRARLVWLVRSEAEPWMPTAHERDQRWNEVYGEKVALTSARRHNSEALLGLSGGRR